MATQDQAMHCINYIHEIPASDENTTDGRLVYSINAVFLCCLVFRLRRSRP